MSIRSEFRIDARHVRKDMQNVEQEVAASSKRQSDTLANEGKKGGERQAQEIIKSLRATFRARQGQLKQDLAEGVIDRKAFAKASNDAKKAFNDGILKALADLQKSGGASAEQMDRLRGALKSVGQQGRRSGEEAASGWEKAKASLGSVGGALKWVGAGIVGVVGALAGYITSLGLLAKRGTEVLGVQTSFTKLVGNQELALQGLRKASYGLVTDFDLMEKFNRSVALGAVNTTEEFGHLIRVAQALGDAQGIALPAALEKLVEGVGKGNSEILRGIGLQVSATEAADAYAKSLGKKASQLTLAERQEGFRIAAMEAARKKMEELGEAEINAGDRVLQMGVAIQNFRDQLAKMVAESPEVNAFFNKIAAFGTDIVAALNGDAETIRSAFEAVGGMAGNAMANALLDGLSRGLNVVDRLLLRMLDPGDKRWLEQHAITPFGWAAGHVESMKADAAEAVTAWREALAAAAAAGRAGAAARGIRGDGVITPPKPTDPPTAPGVDEATRRLRAQTDAMLEEFRLAQRVGLTSLGEKADLPAMLERARERLQEVLRLNREIASVEEQRATATQEQRSELDQILTSLQAQRAAASTAADLAIGRHAGLSGQPSLGLVSGRLAGRETPGLFEGAQLRFDPVIQQMQRVRSAVEGVTEAERELRRAQLEMDLPGQEAATAALAAAKDELRQRVAEVAKVLRGLIKDEEKLAKIQAELADILDDAGVTDGAQAKDWDEIASSVEGVARGVLAVADATGKLDQRTRRTLQGVIDLAAGFNRLKTDPVGGAAQILGGGISLLSGLFGGGGGQAAEASRQAAEELAEQMREQARQIRENTAALRDFNRRALSGTTPAERDRLLGQGQGFLQVLKDIYGEDVVADFRGSTGRGIIFDASRRMGLSESDIEGFLEAIEKLTGLEFFDSERGITSVAEFMRALEALSSKDLGVFGEDLGGRLDALGFITRALGDAAGSAEEQLQRFLDMLRSVPAAMGFADALEKLIQEEGPEAAQVWLQGLAETLARMGVTDELREIFGAGLTAEEIGRAIEEALRFTGGAVGDTGFSRSIQIARTITEVQAIEVIAWLQEIAYTGHEQLAELQSIHAILGQALAGSVPAGGDMIAPAARAGGGFVVNGPITVSPQLTESDFQAIWRRLGEEVWLRKQGRAG